MGIKNKKIKKIIIYSRIKSQKSESRFETKLRICFLSWNSVLYQLENSIKYIFFVLIFVLFYSMVDVFAQWGWTCLVPNGAGAMVLPNGAG